MTYVILLLCLVVLWVWYGDNKDREKREKNISFASSNDKKLAEFSQMVPNMPQEKIGELKEVAADPLTVILYKVKDLNKDCCLIDDSTVEVEVDGIWTEMVDVKWKLHTISSTSRVRWLSYLAYSFEGKIYVYHGSTFGKILDSTENSGKLFRDLFVPEHATKTLAELGDEAVKYSSRKLALDCYLSGRPYMVVEASELEEWTGDYQNEEKNTAG